MRMSVDHRTVYRFSSPQSRLVQMLRMTPGSTDDQTIVSWRVDVDCDARLRPARDGFGNRVLMLYADGPIDAIEICVSGEVLSVPSDGVLNGVTERFPPALFRRNTALTVPDAALIDFARAAAAGATMLDRLHALNVAVQKRFIYCLQRPVHDRTAAAAYAEPRATARDLAHMFIAGARAIGAPARYISGYCRIGPQGLSQPTPHGWAEAYADGLGWVGFDPSMGLSTTKSHVRVAVGLDSAGAAPVAGSRLGEGHEVLDVDISVAAIDPA